MEILAGNKLIEPKFLERNLPLIQFLERIMIFIALWVIVVAFAAVASGIIVGHNSYTKISQTFPTICSVSHN